MRILVLSYFFPPFNAPGAVRVGKTAKYLIELGHDVHVLSCRSQPLPRDLLLEVPEDRVTYTPWINVNRPVELILGGRQAVAHRGYSVPSPSLSRLLESLGRPYREAVNFPDGQVGWISFAVRAGARLLDEWRPDVIFASATPYSSLIAAHRLAKRFDTPWVAELRDLWLDNPYLRHYPLRRSLERPLERRVLSSAAGFVTVSEPLAQVLRAKYSAPVKVVPNGFDPDDYPEPPARAPAAGPLRITYTGTIYPGKRDPSPLLKALLLLGDEARHVKVLFYGRSHSSAARLASRLDVGDSVEFRDPVSHREALALQCASDVTLLLTWNDPRDLGVYTSKLFEYLGARRPILVVGSDQGAAADLIRSRRAGYVLQEAEEIAAQLRRWIAQKRLPEGIPALPATSGSGFERRTLTSELAEFLVDRVEAHRR